MPETVVYVTYSPEPGIYIAYRHGERGLLRGMYVRILSSFSAAINDGAGLKFSIMTSEDYIPVTQHVFARCSASGYFATE